MFVAGHVSALQASSALLAESLEWNARHVVSDEVSATGVAGPLGAAWYRAKQAASASQGTAPPTHALEGATGSRRDVLRGFSPYDATPTASEVWEYRVLGDAARAREASVARQAVDQAAAIREEIAEFGEGVDLEEDDDGAGSAGGAGAATMRSSATAARRRSTAFFASDAASTILGAGSVAGGASTMYMRVRAKGSRTGSKRIVATPTVIPLLSEDTDAPSATRLPPFVRPDPNSHTDGVIANMRRMGGDVRPLTTGGGGGDEVLDTSARALPEGVTDDADAVAAMHLGLRQKYGEFLYVLPAAEGEASLSAHEAAHAPMPNRDTAALADRTAVLGQGHGGAGSEAGRSVAAAATQRTSAAFRQEALAGTFSTQWARAHGGYSVARSADTSVGGGSDPGVVGGGRKTPFAVDPNFALFQALPEEAGVRARLGQLWNTWADAWEAEAEAALAEGDEGSARATSRDESATFGKPRSGDDLVAGDIVSGEGRAGQGKQQQVAARRLARRAERARRDAVADAAEGSQGEGAAGHVEDGATAWGPEADGLDAPAEIDDEEQGGDSAGGGRPALTVGDVTGVLRRVAASATAPTPEERVAGSVPGAAVAFRSAAAGVGMRPPSADALVPSVYTGADARTAPGATSAATGASRSGSRLVAGAPLPASAPAGLGSVRTAATGSTHPLTAGGADVTYDAMNVLNMTTPTLVASAMNALNGLLDALTAETSMVLAEAATGTSGGMPSEAGVGDGGPLTARAGISSGQLELLRAASGGGGFSPGRRGGAPSSPGPRSPTHGRSMTVESIPEGLGREDDEEEAQGAAEGVAAEIGPWGSSTAAAFSPEQRLRDEKAAAAAAAAVAQRRAGALEKADRLAAMSHRVQTVRVAVAEMANRWRTGTATALKSLAQLEHEVEVRGEALELMRDNAWNTEQHIEALQKQISTLKTAVLHDLAESAMQQRGGGGGRAAPPARIAIQDRASAPRVRRSTMAAMPRSPHTGTPLSLASTPPSSAGGGGRPGGARRMVRRSMVAQQAKRRLATGQDSPRAQARNAALQGVLREDPRQAAAAEAAAASHAAAYDAALADAETRLQALLEERKEGTPTQNSGLDTPEHQQVASIVEAGGSPADAADALQLELRRRPAPTGASDSPAPTAEGSSPTSTGRFAALGGSPTRSPTRPDISAMLNRLEGPLAAAAARRQTKSPKSPAVKGVTSPAHQTTPERERPPAVAHPRRLEGGDVDVGGSDSALRVAPRTGSTRLQLHLDEAAHANSTCADLWTAVRGKVARPIAALKLVLDDAADEAMHAATAGVKARSRRYSRLAVSTRPLPNGPLSLKAAGVPLTPTLEVHFAK